MNLRKPPACMIININIHTLKSKEKKYFDNPSLLYWRPTWPWFGSRPEVGNQRSKGRSSYIKSILDFYGRISSSLDKRGVWVDFVLLHWLSEGIGIVLHKRLVKKLDFQTGIWRRLLQRIEGNKGHKPEVPFQIGSRSGVLQGLVFGLLLSLILRGLFESYLNIFSDNAKLMREVEIGLRQLTKRP